MKPIQYQHPQLFDLSPIHLDGLPPEQVRKKLKMQIILTYGPPAIKTLANIALACEKLEYLHSLPKHTIYNKVVLPYQIKQNKRNLKWSPGNLTLPLDNYLHPAHYAPFAASLQDTAQPLSPVGAAPPPPEPPEHKLLSPEELIAEQNRIRKLRYQELYPDMPHPYETAARIAHRESVRALSPDAVEYIVTEHLYNERRREFHRTYPYHILLHPTPSSPDYVPPYNRHFVQDCMARFQVCRSTINNVLYGNTYRHLVSSIKAAVSQTKSNFPEGTPSPPPPKRRKKDLIE